jgi:hypothetical protein
VNNLEIDQHLLAPSNQPTNSPSVFQTLIFHQLFSVTRNECDKVAGDLRNAGIQAIAYHAGLSDSQRSRIQEDWIRDRCKVFIICNTVFSLLFCVSQPPDTFKKIADCVNYKIKLKQSNFERNTEIILGFERFHRKLYDIEKNCLLM